MWYNTSKPSGMSGGPGTHPIRATLKPEGFVMPSVEERFWAKVIRTDACWKWLGAHDSDGYSSFSFEGRSIRAHQYSYWLAFGQMPLMLEIDHLCRNPGCVNPKHLQAVTHQTNMHRGHWGQTRHCIRGHPFDALNTYHYRGKRYCRQCDRLRSHRKYERHKHVTRGANLTTA